MFIPSIGREGPVILIYDGHASHIGIQVIKLVIKNNIHLLRSPSHTTHLLLQPFDVSVYGPIRMAWVQILVEFSYSHIGKALTKEGFPALLKQIWLRGFTGSNVIAGFKATGIVPFHSSCITAKSYKATSALSYGRTDTAHEEATPNDTSIPSATTLGSSRDERASLDTSVEVAPSSVSASTPDIKKFFLKRLKVHGPSGGDLKDILFLCDI